MSVKCSVRKCPRWGFAPWSILISLALGPTLSHSQNPVSSVTRASPRYAEQGSQVNLWLVGDGFQSGAQVSFNIPGIGPAEAEGMPFAPKVFPQADSENGQRDGIQYFIRVAAPPEAPPGFVDITVTNPDGSRATGRNLFEIVAPGTVPRPEPGEDNVSALTGASPRAAFIGQRVALWLWGEGIAEGAEIIFDNPAVSAFRPPEVVKDSASHPGYSGVRNYLVIDPNAQPGPVGITIRNPNRTQVSMPNLFQLVEGNGEEGGTGAFGVEGNCPDRETSIAGITAVSPQEIQQGQVVTISVEGQAFACGAQILISGGGLRSVSQPELFRTPLNPFETRMTWEIEVGYEATLGPRDVTIINPNNTSKTATAAFVIVEGEALAEASFGCQTHAGKASWASLILLVLCCARRRKRISESLT